MAKKVRGSKRAAAATSKVITRAGDRLALALGRAQHSSERAVTSWVRTLERYGEPPAMPTSEMRQVVEASFQSAEKVLKAQRAYALGVISSLEKPARKATAGPRKARVAAKPAKEMPRLVAKAG